MVTPGVETCVLWLSSSFPGNLEASKQPFSVIPAGAQVGFKEWELVYLIPCLTKVTEYHPLTARNQQLSYATVSKEGEWECDRGKIYSLDFHVFDSIKSRLHTSTRVQLMLWGNGRI